MDACFSGSQRLDMRLSNSGLAAVILEAAERVPGIIVEIIELVAMLLAFRLIWAA